MFVNVNIWFQNETEEPRFPKNVIKKSQPVCWSVENQSNRFIIKGMEFPYQIFIHPQFYRLGVGGPFSNVPIRPARAGAAQSRAPDDFLGSRH